MTDKKEMAMVTVRVEDTYTATVHTGHHIFLADEPEKAGGHDEGPNPEAYLLSALGACMSITLRMYANKKGWPLESVETELRHHRSEGHIDGVDIKLKLNGPLNEEQISRLHEIAQKCPMHKTLTAGVDITTHLAG